MGDAGKPLAESLRVSRGHPNDAVGTILSNRLEIDSEGRPPGKRCIKHVDGEVAADTAIEKPTALGCAPFIGLKRCARLGFD
jgi:hypothetical protein